jgi:ADP-ribose pyrophosphatase YjhB (NUDIX family)
VSAPDPRLTLIKAGYSLSQNPGTLLRVARTPHREARDSSRGSGLYPRRSWTLPGGLVRICRGPTLSHGVRTHR